MKKEYIITYRINDEEQRSRFELLMWAGFEKARKKRYRIVKFYEIKSSDDEKEMERKIRLIADEIIWERDDYLEILNLSVEVKETSLRETDEEKVIVRGDGKLEEKVIKWMEMMFWMQQFKEIKK
jgi:hypothetical protein